MTNWAPVVTVGLVNLVGLAFAAGAVFQRLKASEAAIEALPKTCDDAAEKRDMQHLIDCHPRAAKRAQSQLEIQ